MPGVYVWGSNDYYAPTFKNPLATSSSPAGAASTRKSQLPWQDLGAASRRPRLDRPHPHADDAGDQGRPDWGSAAPTTRTCNHDHYAEVAGPVDRAEVDVAIGVTHAPYRRVIDAMADDGLT